VLKLCEDVCAACYARNPLQKGKNKRTKNAVIYENFWNIFTRKRVLIVLRSSSPSGKLKGCFLTRRKQS